jgi:hypothetical protein
VRLPGRCPHGTTIGLYCGVCSAEKDARIAELEAELANWKASSDTYLAKWKKEAVLRSDATAELAALEARRCPTCYFANGSDQWGVIFCAMGIKQSGKDFYCGMWELRQDGES